MKFVYALHNSIHSFTTHIFREAPNFSFFYRQLGATQSGFRLAVLKMSETLQLRGNLYGHSGWVTQIATNPKYPDTILSSSRGKFNIISKCDKIT